jgi:hypothetical protein
MTSMRHPLERTIQTRPRRAVGSSASADDSMEYFVNHPTAHYQPIRADMTVEGAMDMLYQSLSSQEEPYADAATAEAPEASTEEHHVETSTVQEHSTEDRYSGEWSDQALTAAVEYFAESSVPAPTSVEATNGHTDRVPVSDVAHQLTALAQTLSHSLEELEAEQAESLARIHALEEMHQQALNQVSALEEMRQQALDQVRAFEETHRELRRVEGVSNEDLQAVQDVASALVENPHHIVFLAKLSEHASVLAAVVEDYARLRDILAEQ